MFAYCITINFSQKKIRNVIKRMKEPVAKEPVYWNDFTLWDTATRYSRDGQNSYFIIFSVPVRKIISVQEIYSDSFFGKCKVVNYFSKCYCCIIKTTKLFFYVNLFNLKSPLLLKDNVHQWQYSRDSGIQILPQIIGDLCSREFYSFDRNFNVQIRKLSTNFIQRVY